MTTTAAYRRKLAGLKKILRQFGEDCTFARRGSGENYQPVRASIEQGRETLRSEGTNTLSDVIEVCVLRDENDADFPGVAKWQVGDALKRDPDVDLHGNGPFVFRGEYRTNEYDVISTTAVFERQTSQTQGRGGRPV